MAKHKEDCFQYHQEAKEVSKQRERVMSKDHGGSNGYNIWL